MSHHHSGRNRDSVIRELITEQNELQTMMVDILSTIADSNPDIVFKYSEFIARVKTERERERERFQAMDQEMVTPIRF